MNTLPRLLCLTLLSSAAFAQGSSPAFVTADPSLAREVQVAKAAPKPAPGALTSQATLQPRSTLQGNTLPVATVLRLKLAQSVSTATARQGQMISATLTAPVQLNGQTLFPTGTVVNCRVERAHGARRFAGKPSLTIKVHGIRTENDEELPISASVVDTGTPQELSVDQEGNVRGSTPNPLNKIEAASLTGAGAVAGAVIAGPEGLLVGTASGALIAAGHIVVKYRDLTLPAGTELIFESDSPVAVPRSSFSAAQ